MIEALRCVPQPGQPVGGGVQAPCRGPRLNQVRRERIATGIAGPGPVEHVGDRLKPPQGRPRVVDRELYLAEHPATLSREDPVPLGFSLVETACGVGASPFHVAVARLDERREEGHRPAPPMAAFLAPANSRLRVADGNVPVACPPLDVRQQNPGGERVVAASYSLRLSQNGLHQLTSLAALAPPQAQQRQRGLRSPIWKDRLRETGKPDRLSQLLSGSRLSGEGCQQTVGGQRPADQGQVLSRVRVPDRGGREW